MNLLSRAGSNPKTSKAGKLGILTVPLHLAPASLSGFNVCPLSTEGCRAACLHTAGNIAYMPQKTKGRLAKTQFFFRDRQSFLSKLRKEIAAHERKAKRLGMKSAIRLNATSDLHFETFGIYESFPDTQFYDYTKRKKVAVKFGQGKLPPNYHVTFSRSESNESDCLDVLRSGGNVAVVFASTQLPKTWKGFPVINGEEYDFRPLDGKGVVVGLYAKGKAKQDHSGFVVQSMEGKQ